MHNGGGAQAPPFSFADTRPTAAGQQGAPRRPARPARPRTRRRAERPAKGPQAPANRATNRAATHCKARAPSAIGRVGTTAAGARTRARAVFVLRGGGRDGILEDEPAPDERRRPQQTPRKDSGAGRTLRNLRAPHRLRPGIHNGPENGKATPAPDELRGGRDHTGQPGRRPIRPEQHARRALDLQRPPGGGAEGQRPNEPAAPPALGHLGAEYGAQGPGWHWRPYRDTQARKKAHRSSQRET